MLPETSHPIGIKNTHFIYLQFKSYIYSTLKQILALYVRRTASHRWQAIMSSCIFSEFLKTIRSAIQNATLVYRNNNNKRLVTKFPNKK